MRTKILEIRDRKTFIPVVATLMVPINPRQGPLLRSVGYAEGTSCVLLTRAIGGQAYYEPYGWADRTMTAAHQYIEKNWDGIGDGDVVDVEYILGETSAPKKSEVTHD